MFTIDLEKLTHSQKCLVDTFRSTVRFEGFGVFIPNAVLVTKTETTVTFNCISDEEVKPLLNCLV